MRAEAEAEAAGEHRAFFLDDAQALDRAAAAALDSVAILRERLDAPIAAPTMQSASPGPCPAVDAHLARIRIRMLKASCGGAFPAGLHHSGNKDYPLL